MSSSNIARPYGGVIGAGIALVAVIILSASALLIRHAQGGGTPQGCFVVTDDLGRTFYATDQPQYNPTVGLRLRTVDGEAWVLRPASVVASDACIAGVPVPEATP